MSRESRDAQDVGFDDRPTKRELEAENATCACTEPEDREWESDDGCVWCFACDTEVTF